MRLKFINIFWTVQLDRFSYVYVSVTYSLSDPQKKIVKKIQQKKYFTSFDNRKCYAKVMSKVCNNQSIE
jgi:hypothetical protein